MKIQSLHLSVFKPVVFAILTVFLLMLFSGCPEVDVPRNWTVMVYMAADNNLEPAALADITEMEAADIDNSGMDVIVLVDLNEYQYSGSTVTWDDTRLYKIKHDKYLYDDTIVSTQLASSELGLTTTSAEELNMGDPAICSSFIDFCKTNYPSDYYMLIYWDHGSGWLKKSISGSDPENLTKYICVDEYGTDDGLYTKEIGDSIEGKNLTVVGFDLCYGAMLEIAYEIRNDAKYMIASEETEPGDGWEYNDWINGFASYSASKQTSANLIKEIVNSYADRYSDTTGTTLSGIDLTKISALSTALDTFSNTVYAYITDSTKQSEIQSLLFNNVEDFYDNTDSDGDPAGTGDLNIDIRHMAEVFIASNNVADTEAAALAAAVDDVVVYEWHNSATGSDGNPNANGIAIHLIYMDAYSPSDISYAYWKGYSWSYPLQFVTYSAWVPVYSTGPGFLYRIWYESL